MFSLGHWPTGFREEPVDKAKPFSIAKRAVWEAFKRVKANQGAAGVDGQSIADFEANLTGNLKGWKRFPAAEEWLLRNGTPVAAGVDPDLARVQAARAAPNDPAAQQRLYQQFMEWAKAQGKK